MQAADEPFQLRSLPVIFDLRAVARVGRKEADRVVAPVIQQRLPVHFPHAAGLVKLKDRHELNGIDAQILKIGDLFHDAGKRAAVRHACAFMLSKAAHMKLIDDAVLQWRHLLTRHIPDKIIMDDPGLVKRIIRQLHAPLALSGDCPGIRIEQIPAAVKQQAPMRIIGSLQRIGITYPPSGRRRRSTIRCLPDSFPGWRCVHKVLAPDDETAAARMPLPSERRA